MIGTTTRDALEALDRDDRTEAVVLVGEIGGTMEEEASEYARTMKKPIVSFIAGRSSPPDKKMGHAGAIVTGGRGGYDSKRAALEKAGVRVADTPAEISEFLSEVMMPAPAVGRRAVAR
jgi:succinyl-CoA synthetase alpha subunit